MVVGLTDVEIRKANKWQQVGSSDHKINSRFQRKSLDSSQWRVNSICSAFPLPRQLTQRNAQILDTDALGAEQTSYWLQWERAQRIPSTKRSPHSFQHWSLEGGHHPQTWEQTLRKTSLPQLLSWACYCCQHNCQTVVCPVQDLAFTDAR